MHGWLATALIAGKIWAGGSGYNVAIVVNQNSTNSLQLANAYCEARGVPPQNVVLLSYQWPGGAVSCSLNDFQGQLLNPLLSAIQTRGLARQIQYVVLSMDLPYEVSATNGLNSTTSALYYGFKPDTNPPQGLPITCSLPDDSSNSYAFSELPFSQFPPNTALTNSFLAVMLTQSNLPAAELLLDQGVAGDGSFPAQPVYLEKTSDPVRNVRFYEFDNAIFNARLNNDDSLIRTNTDSTAFTNLLGEMTGMINYSVPSNAFVAGAIADNLTSYGGYLFVPDNQTTLIEFLDAGASASYGTVVEPCNYPQKFPNPLDYFYQNRGFSIAEAYYQSLGNPYQGLIVGEPLSAPFATRGSATWLEPAVDAAIISGQTNLQFQFTAANSEHPLRQVDLFVDGTWFATLTNVSPIAGTALELTVNGVSNHYIVPTNATLYSIASNLTEVLNAASNTTLVSALPFGDRIELHGLNPSEPGAAIAIDGTASNNMFALPAQPTFLDSMAEGFHYLQVNNTPSVNDWVRLAITRTNGAQIMLGVTNTSGSETIGQLMQTLFNDVNNTAALLGSDGLYAADFDDESSTAGYAGFNVDARSPGWAASAIQVNLTASPDLSVQSPAVSALQDNLSDLQTRDNLFLACGQLSLTVNYTFDTSRISDGYHELAAIAYEGDSVQTQTRVSRTVIVQNTPLRATLNTLYGGSNTDVSASLQFSVVANSNNIASIQLYSTGGLLAEVVNQSTAYFSIAGANLGIGLHPFYANVIDNAGHQYRTATTWIRLLGVEPGFTISATFPPLTLSWPATVGRAYNIFESTNVRGPYGVIGTIIPSNSIATWTNTNAPQRAQFYQVRTSD